MNNYNVKAISYYMIGLICHKHPRKIGKPSNSPGLEHDAIVYEEQLLLHGFTVVYIKPWTETKEEITTCQKLIDDCSVLIGFEELGSNEVISCIKQSTTPKTIFLIPNLEATINIEDCPKGKWAPTLKNLYLVDHIISKNISKVFDELVVKMYSTYKITSIPNIIHIPHCSPPLVSIEDKVERNSILIFNGSSPYKNCYNQLKASLKLLKIYPRLKKVVVVIINRTSHSSLDDINRIKNLAYDNSNKVQLIVSGYMSDIDKSKLYKEALLCLCASNCEGFGHYIQDSISSGCLTVTTDGFPMNDLKGLSIGTTTECKGSTKGLIGFAFAFVDTTINFGLFYAVTPEAIMDACNSLEINSYDETVEKRIKELYQKRCELFKISFENEMIKLVN